MSPTRSTSLPWEVTKTRDRRFAEIVLALSGPVARADIPALCERARVLLDDRDTDLLICDVGALVDPDVATVEALARLQLTALRLGYRLRIRSACGELQGLLALTGLEDVLLSGAGSVLQPRGESEEREQARRVQEEADAGDPPL